MTAATSYRPAGFLARKTEKKDETECFLCSPPNSGEFGYDRTQPLGVSPRFPAKPTRSVRRVPPPLPKT